jgi:HAE1 family hydrophobic/amphiphilic exporter-1
MSIYKTAINKPITTALIFVAVMILGIFSYTKLPVDQFPEIEPPYVTVMTTYPGANASEIETKISKILENALNSVDGLKNIYSTSKDNISIVTLEFEWGADIDEALNDIRSYVDLVYDNLPDGVSRPTILKLNSSAAPIMVYGFTAKESYPGLEKIIDENITNVLNRIDGIGNITVSGAPERYIYIDLDPKQLDAYHLSVEAVGNAIATNNLNLASGTVKMGKEQYQLRVESEYKESSEINNIVVMTTRDGKQVFVRDLATVRDTIKDVTLDEKINGLDGARLMITKQTGANTVDIAKKVRAEMEKITKTLPPDIQVHLIRDGSEEIQNAISSLEESVMYALLFVVLVVWFFLGSWRTTLIIGVTIPISLLTAFIYLLATGSSLNIISLASLSVAIGMVVDDAIVVLENISKHVDRGSSPREASIYATNEVWTSIIATTLVIVVVFVPLTMLSGIAGIMFKELGWIVTIVVCTSTLVAISLTPMMSSKLLIGKPIFLTIAEKLEAQKKEAEKNKHSLWGILEGWFKSVEAWYANVLRVCLNHKKLTLLITFGLFIISLIPFGMGKIGMDFMKEQDAGQITITAELQRGTRLEETLLTARKIEKTVQKVVGEDLVIVSSTTGSTDDAGFAALFSSTDNTTIQVTVKTTKKYARKTNRTIFEISEAIRNELKAFPEIINYQVGTSRQMGMGGNSVSVEIYGYDFDKTLNTALDLKRNIQNNVVGARDIKIDRKEDRAELQINFDKEKMARLGLNSSTVAALVRYRVYGMTAGYFKEDGEEYNIVVRLDEEDRNSISDIENLSFTTSTGGTVKLNEIAQIKEYWCPPEISRKNRQRIVTIDITPYKTSLSKLAVSIQDEINKMDLPQGVYVNVGGSYEDQQESFSDMGMLALLIMLLVYIVMASQFESFSKPFIIMMAIPFAITGVILALLITGENLDMVGSLGVILLIGIVVKNGIVLVDYINLMRDRGYELNEAIALSGQSRLRPVMMTALTTILGMVPMSLSRSEGSELWNTMGYVVIGGSLVSTLITLLVVPVMYAMMSKHSERNKEEEVRKSFVFMNIELEENNEEKENK